MAGKFLSRRIVLAIISSLVVGAFIFSGTTMGYALRPRSAAEDEGRSATLFGYGFESDAGRTLAHDKIFKIEAATAFTEGRAVQLFGHQAAKDLNDVAAEFLKKSGEVGISQERLVKRLKEAQNFLNEVFTADFINRVVNELANLAAQISEETKQKADAKSAYHIVMPDFLDTINAIAKIEDPEIKAKEAKSVIVDETRFVTFIFGEKGLDPYLFNVGNILSKEYRALVAHIGRHPYPGSEHIGGKARTIYTTLARIEGFVEHGLKGVAAYREMMLHEFMDRAYGRHVDPSADVLVQLNTINAEIDKKYNNVATEVIQEEGSVIVSNPQVKIEKYRQTNDLGMKEVFAIRGSSNVHPLIPKGKEVTVTIAKADVGSIGGHGTAPGAMLEAVAEIWMKAAQQGYILDFFITRVGDDISVTVTHAKGKDDVGVHKLIWDGFVHAAVIAKDLGYYGAGQDLLADAFSGNVRGAGPSVAEMVIKEQSSEVLIIGQADKTAPGAFNRGLYKILFGPDTTWRPLGKGQARDIKVGVLDFDYNNKAGRHIWFEKEDYDDAYWFLGYPDRYTIDNVTLGNGQDFAAVTAQRLGIIAGEYVGKDDPMFMMRSQSAFPAVGEITSAFLTGEYIVPGWMRGSNKGPFFPVALTDAKIGIYDGPPLLSMWSFNLNNGRLEGFYDLMAANPAIRYVQDRRAAAAVRQLEEGFHEMGLRLGPEEIEYQAGPKNIERALQGRWEEYAPKKGVAKEQEEADKKHEDIAKQVAAQKTEAVLETLLQSTWGEKLAIFAKPFAADIHHRLSAKVIELNNKQGGKAYPILINHESLLKASPDGIMALQEISSQLGIGNIKLVLHIARDDIKPDEVDRILDEKLAKINSLNNNYTNINRDMFAAVVVGTNAEQVSAQVKEKVGEGIYQVIGPETYALQFKDVIRVILNQANEGQLTLMAKALKLGLELIPSDGKVSNEDLKKLDELFSQDQSGNFHVQAGDVVASVVNAAEEYARQVEAEVRV